MRAAITIIYNGLNHLNHKGFIPFMLANFDYWVIVEGASRNGGSTSWCKTHKGGHNSTDGTIELIQSIQSDKVMVYSHHTFYKSKDEQFNQGIKMLKTKIDSCYLWQVDCDEHWAVEDIELAERKLWRSEAKCASFQFNHWVKDDVLAVGDWGSGRVNRLWKWRGQYFNSHEPAIMKGQTKVLELPMKFNHYSMIFADDVKFKARFYRGHEQVYLNWQKMDEFQYPCHISKLFGTNNPVGRSNSHLYKINHLSCVNAISHVSQKPVEIKC